MNSSENISGKKDRPSKSYITAEYEEQRNLCSFVYRFMLWKCTDTSNDSIFNLKLPIQVSKTYCRLSLHNVES